VAWHFERLYGGDELDGGVTTGCFLKHLEEFARIKFEVGRVVADNAPLVDQGWQDGEMLVLEGREMVTVNPRRLLGLFERDTLIGARLT
jgi:hypothetical protein